MNTDFSNLLYVFFDEPNNVIMGVTSSGDEIVVALADNLPGSEVLIIGGIPVDGNLAIIDLALVGEDIVDASGEAVRLDSGSVFQINDLAVLDIPLGVDLEGECDSVEPLDGISSASLKSVVSDLTRLNGQDVNDTGLVNSYTEDISGQSE